MDLSLQTLWSLLSGLGTLVGVIVVGVITNALWDYLKIKQLPKISAYWAGRAVKRQKEFEEDLNRLNSDEGRIRFTLNTILYTLMAIFALLFISMVMISQMIASDTKEAVRVWSWIALFCGTMVTGNLATRFRYVGSVYEEHTRRLENIKKELDKLEASIKP